MNRIYHVSWSKISIAITIAVFAIVAVITVGLLIEDTRLISMEFLIVGFVLICLLYVASYTPIKIEVSDNKLIIQRIVGSTNIPIDGIIGCSRYYKTFLTKICGSGGFCGSLGWYRANDVGIFISYVTDWNNAILINAGDKKYMISCNNPDAFIAHLESISKKVINAIVRSTDS